MFAAIGAPRCCGFLATPANISRFDVATGLTHLGSEVDCDWALAGGVAMGVHSSLTLSARSSLGPAQTLRCDHCREEFGIRVHRYWHMHFCSSACMTAYQRRLAPETKVKISELEASRESLAASKYSAVPESDCGRNNTGSLAMFAAHHVGTFDLAQCRHFTHPLSRQHGRRKC
jgi:hypothetical protein